MLIENGVLRVRAGLNPVLITVPLGATAIAMSDAVAATLWLGQKKGLAKRGCLARNRRSSSGVTPSSWQLRSNSERAALRALKSIICTRL